MQILSPLIFINQLATKIVAAITDLYIDIRFERYTVGSSLSTKNM